MEDVRHHGSSYDGVPITERSNYITENIDIAASGDIVRQLYCADQEIFGSSHEYPGILHKDVLVVVEDIVAICAELLQDTDNNIIVLSGCGTSGRLAFMAATSMNKRMSAAGLRPCFVYLIAGKDAALFVSQESSEDDPVAGKQDLCDVSAGKHRVLYIGITCGLSAPYVAGQLDYCLDNCDRFIPVLLGFNPVSVARDVPVEKWDKTFKQVCDRLVTGMKQRKTFILTPFIGPEPITGSTRMKSGSATKMLLETICLLAYLRTHGNVTVPVMTALDAYQEVQRVAYENVSALAQLVDYGGNSLTSEGHIYYISAGWLGVVGLVDASECTPTYGAARDDVRGFIVGGFPALGNRDGDLSNIVDISTDYFERSIVPKLTAADLLVILVLDGDVYRNERVWQSCAKKVCLYFITDGSTACLPADVLAHVSLHHVVSVSKCDPSLADWFRHYAEMACKWTCNVLTTGAHVLRGKVCSNYMVDVRVSNNKLFYRAVGIVQRFGRCSADEATSCLLRSVYDTDLLTDPQRDAPISEHVRCAQHQQQIVAVAIVMAAVHCSPSQAKQRLRNCPVIRTAVTQCLN